MSTEKQKPQFMIVYKCSACGQESGYTELDKPSCRFCEAEDSLEIVSKKELTPEVMAERLKAVTDNMMKNIESAYQTLPDFEKGEMGDKDPEEELLKLMAKMQKFREQVQNLKLKASDEEGD
jgi:hypothetical protein